MYTKDWKNLVIGILNSWFFIRKSMYFIAIKDIFFCNKKRQIMIKYQCLNKRIGAIISLEEYMSSPLKHATYPDQLFHIGMQTEKFLSEIQNCKPRIDTQMQDQLSRFKRIFYDHHEHS